VFLPETADIRSSHWVVLTVDNPGSAPDYEASGMDSCSEAQEWSQTLRDSLERESRAPATVRINIVIDTVGATFEAEELLYALRDFPVVLQASPIGFLFSFIKVFCEYPEFILPDRADLTASTPCLRAYNQHLLGIARRRDVAMLGAWSVDEDDSAWQGPRVEAADLLQVPRGRITENGVRSSMREALKYLAGDKSIDRIDAEFARAQLWQWLRHETGVLDSGLIISESLFDRWLEEEREKLVAAAARKGIGAEPVRAAALELAEISKMPVIVPFLSCRPYRVPA
jgi:malate synthase